MLKLDIFTYHKYVVLLYSSSEVIIMGTHKSAVCYYCTLHICKIVIVPDAKLVRMSSSWMSSGDLLLPSTATTKNLQWRDINMHAFTSWPHTKHMTNRSQDFLIFLRLFVGLLVCASPLIMSAIVMSLMLLPCDFTLANFGSCL